MTKMKLIVDAMGGDHAPEEIVRGAYEGKKKAVEIYQEWMNLPVVPFGTVNAALGAKSDTHRCGLLDHDGWIYISSAVEIDNPELLLVSQTEFAAVTAEIRAKSVCAENMLNAENAN